LNGQKRALVKVLQPQIAINFEAEKRTGLQPHIIKKPIKDTKTKPAKKNNLLEFPDMNPNFQKYVYYSVRDQATQRFNSPFIAQSAVDARRIVALTARPGSSLATLPDLFDLFVVGEYSEQHGHFLQIAPKFIASVTTCIAEFAPKETK